MDYQQAEKLIEELKSSEREEILIEKEDFLVFREVLVERDDFKHIRGIAQRGGACIYHYTKEARS